MHDQQHVMFYLMAILLIIVSVEARRNKAKLQLLSLLFGKNPKNVAVVWFEQPKGVYVVRTRVICLEADSVRLLASRIRSQRDLLKIDEIITLQPSAHIWPGASYVRVPLSGEEMIELVACIG